MQEMLTPSGRRCSRGSWKSAPLLCVLSSPLEPPRSFSHRLTLFGLYHVMLGLHSLQMPGKLWDKTLTRAL